MKQLEVKGLPKFKLKYKLNKTKYRSLVPKQLKHHFQIL
jgi:hypothetical protein